MSFQMRDGPNLERQRFVHDAKTAYHAEPFQLQLQQRDKQESNKKFKDGKHIRWGREMQRRCGSKVLWEIISFTGKFSVEFLTEVRAASANDNSDAPQLAVNHDDAKAHAVKCRGRLRWAVHLDKKRQQRPDRKFSEQDGKLLRDFDSGKLRRDANEATKSHGHGRLKSSDGIPSALSLCSLRYLPNVRFIVLGQRTCSSRKEIR